MHRFVVASPITGAGQRVTLPREESVHAAKVLRLRPGENVQLLDGEALYDAVLDVVDEKEAVAIVTALCPSPEPPAQVTLWQGLPKADKLEMIVQKATELGAWEICPVEMTRCVAKADKGGKDKKQERLNRIALEAAKQSGRAHVPAVTAVQTLKQAARQLAEFDLVLLPWEEEHAMSVSRAVGEYCRLNGMPAKVLIIIGPEGGISTEEKEMLAANGAVSVTLGKRILRTETAGLCAVSVLWAALGEM